MLVNTKLIPRFEDQLLLTFCNAKSIDSTCVSDKYADNETELHGKH